MSIENVAQEQLTAAEETVTTYSEMAIDFAMTYGPKVVIAIVSLIIGFWIINKVVGAFEKHLLSRSDKTLASFLRSLASIFLKVILLIIVASNAGIETTSLVAVLGAAGLAVGLALQGSLSNFAGGVLILFFKPFKVGDLIEAQGYIATVTEIQILYTTLLTADNRRVVIPNGALSNGSLVNINHESKRRVDFVFGIAYDDDIDKARAIIDRIAEADERVLKDPKKMIVLTALADSSVNLAVRLWVNTPDYWGVYFDTQEAVKKAFDAEGVSIPFPQRDVHIYETKQAG